MYLISIYFDDKTEKRLQSFIQKVAKETGNTFMVDNQVPPHMTVAAVETKHEDLLIGCTERLIKNLKCGDIKWVSVGSFSSQVIYVQPVLNEYLHNLSMTITEELGQIEETICSPYYQPFSWLPHCTIAKQLSKEQVVQAFQVLQNDFAPMDGRVVRIGIAKTNPHRDIKVWEIGGDLKRSIRNNINLPYILHDMNVISFEITDNDIVMRTQSGIVETTTPCRQLDGYIEFYNVQWDFSYVYLLGVTGNVGTFTGEKLFLKDFIERYKQFGFSIMDETYGYNMTKYCGYLLTNRQHYECVVEIYHEGDMVFVVED